VKLRKARADAWGEDLPEETRWEIYGLTKPPREGDENRPHLKSYEDAREHAAARGITPPSRAGWYRFLERMRQEDRLRLVYRVSGSCGTAGDLTKEAKVTNRTAAEAFRALAVDAAMGEDAETAALYKAAAQTFLEADIKDRAQKTRDEQLALAERKFEDERTRRTAAEAENARLQARVTELEKALQEAGKTTIADPERIAAEMDKLLGRKKS